MARIPDSFIQDLLNRLDIVTVVEQYLPLKRGGQNYIACCPFHKEKSPSFTVSPTKQFYHCFGCGAHGSALGFVMAYEGLGFLEAVEKLAGSVGMQVPREAQHTPVLGRGRQPQLLELNQRAMAYYREQLKQHPQAIEYLKRRGLTGQIAARFGLGYAPPGWHPLAEAFGDYATNPQLAEVGLVIDHEDTGRRYDRFRDRIMFPILDAKSQVVGFGGRVLGQGEPKYLNSPETPLFQKGLELYGLPQARQAIRTQNRVLVVEGYMDVVALAQLGVEYAVATLGTACTPDHVRKLLRLADQVVFCFDGDNAGRKAAWRALENSLGQVSDGKMLSFLFLPAEHDPDSYIRAHGREAFETLIAREALGMVAFLTKELAGRVDMDSEEGRARLLHLAQPLVQAVTAPALGALLRKRLAEMAGLDRLPDEMGPIPTRTPVRRERRMALSASTHRPAKDLGAELLQLLMFAPQRALEMPHSLPPTLLRESPTLAAIQCVVDHVNEQAEPPLAAHLLEALRDSDYHAIMLDAHRRAEEFYGRAQPTEFDRAWQEGLARFLLALESRQVADRLAELQSIGLARMSDEEKAEFARLAAAR
jgi:DNA primase